MTTAVWFDLDGTLVDYDDPGEGWFRRACEDLGVGFERAAWEHYQERFFALPWHEGDPYLAAARETVERFALGADPRKLAWGFTAAELDDARTPPAVRELVAELAESEGIRLGVLTDGVGYVQRAKLSVCGFDGTFDEVLVAGETGHFKPDPEAFALATERLPADRQVMVGDSAERDAAAADHGFETVLVGHDGAATSATASADLVLADHDEFGRIRDALDVPEGDPPPDA